VQLRRARGVRHRELHVPVGDMGMYPVDGFLWRVLGSAERALRRSLQRHCAGLSVRLRQRSEFRELLLFGRLMEVQRLLTALNAPFDVRRSLES